MKKIKDTIAGILYRIITLLVKLLPAKKGTDHLLLIKLDEIGDYMLFRNLLKSIRQSDKYKGYKITMIGNAAWKQIFDEYDAATVDDVIWITKKKFNKDLGYRFKVLKETRNLRTSDVINCIFSRSIILDDGFAMVATGDNKIAMKGDASNSGKYGISLDKFIYTQIISAGEEHIFDSIRNKNFVGELLMTDKVTCDSKIGLEGSGVNSDYFAIFLGAGNPERRWPIEHFVACSQYVWDNYRLKTAIFGSAPDEDNAKIFLSLFKGEAVNYVSKTTLPEFIKLLNKAQFMISVDTGPLHMGVAAGCPVVGLFSGKYYKRYSPYPKEITTEFYPVYPDFIDELISKNDPVIFDQFTIKNDTIKLIPFSKVIPLINILLKNKVSAIPG